MLCWCYSVQIFKEIKCHRETTECEYQTIPDEETGFDLTSYRCVCKSGYEYPFNSTKNYFEDAIIEHEYVKMLRGEINVYESMQCLPIDRKLEPRYYTSDSDRNEELSLLFSISYICVFVFTQIFFK